MIIVILLESLCRFAVRDKTAHGTMEMMKTTEIRIAEPHPFEFGN